MTEQCKGSVEIAKGPECFHFSVVYCQTTGRPSLQIKGFVARFILCFSFGTVQSTFLYKRHQYQHIRVKTVVGHQLNFSMFNELCRCCLQQQGLLSVCSEQPTVLATPRVIWEFLQDPFGQQLNRMYSQNWKLHLVSRHGQLGLLFPHHLGIFLGWPSYILESH